MADGSQTKAVTGLAAAFMGAPGAGAGAGGLPSLSAGDRASSDGGIFTVDNSFSGISFSGLRKLPWYAWAAVSVVAIVALKLRKG